MRVALFNNASERNPALLSKSEELKTKSGELEDHFPLFSEIPSKIAAMLPTIGKKADKKDVSSAILVLCDWRPLMPSEIAEYLKRKSTKRLVEGYINSLTDSGFLARTIPETRKDRRINNCPKLLR